MFLRKRRGAAAAWTLPAYLVSGCILAMAVPSSAQTPTPTEQPKTAEAPSFGVTTADSEGTRTLVTHVFANSPAARAGLRVGDVITALDAKPVQGGTSYFAALEQLPIGKTIAVGVARDGQVLSLDVQTEGTLPLYSRLCDAADFLACGTIGYMLITGSRVHADSKGGEGYLAKACDGGHTASCLNLGNAYWLGPADVRNLPLAVKTYSRACDTGVAAACINLARLFQRGGDGVPASAERAIAIYERACDAGDAISCRTVGLTVSFRPDPTDKARADKLMQRACDLGDQAACYWIKTKGQREADGL